MLHGGALPPRPCRQPFMASPFVSSEHLPMASSHLRKTFKMNDKDQNKPIKGLQRMQKQMQGRGNLEITVTNILKEGGEDIAPIKHEMLQKRNKE